MSDAEPIRSAAARALGSSLTEVRRVPGGDLNDAFAGELADGRRVFVKTARDAEPGRYAAEAAGLRWIAEVPGAPLVPEVLAVVEDEAPRMLVLSWISPGRLSCASEEALGRGLAALHRADGLGYGASAPGASEGMRIGPLRLPAGPLPSWPEAYSELRLRPLARRAAAVGSLGPEGLEAVERVCERLVELAGPAEPPARLHGDLWSGNVLADGGGEPWLIDPAAHGGHREFDLSMLRLFGGPGERLFSAYHEAFPLSDGHQERVGLWQLFPLLVHAVLFGGGYGARAAAIARRYAGPPRRPGLN